MKQILIFALLLVAISSYNLTFYTGTATNKIHTAADYVDVTTAFATDAGFSVGEDRTFSFYFKIGQLQTGSSYSSGYGYIFWLENTSEEEGIYLSFSYNEDLNDADENQLEFSVDGPLSEQGEAEFDNYVNLDQDAVDYWCQVIFVYDSTNAQLKYALNTSTLTILAGSDLAWTTAASEFDDFNDVGFFEDDDTEDALTTVGLTIDDFRVFDAALNSTELGAEVACTDDQYIAGVYYGHPCDYSPDGGDDDGDSGVLIQISLLFLMIALIFLY